MAVDLESLDVNINIDISDDTNVDISGAADNSFSTGLTANQDDNIFDEVNQLDVDIDMTISDNDNLAIDLSEIDDIFSMDLNTDSVSVGNGTYDYNELNNKPKINGTELIHDVPLENIGVDTLTNNELENLLNWG